MELCTRANWTRFTKLIPEIRANINDWKIVSVHLKEAVKNHTVINDIAVTLSDFMAGWDGAIFIISEKEIACFVRLGKEVDLPKFKNGVARNLDSYNCRVQAKSATLDGVKRLEIVVTANWNKGAGGVNPFQKQRAMRKNRVVMVVDDDKFLRSLMSKAASKFGDVVELANGEELIKVYGEVCPDAVLLDIHMPGKKGSELLREIYAIDEDAYVVMVSADMAREHIVETRLDGAKAYINKPISLNKIETALARCKSINPATAFDPTREIEAQLSRFEKIRSRRTGKVILVVDDDMFIRTMLTSTANNFGQIVEFTDGENLLEQYNQLAPDAVFLDIHLPNHDGKELLKQIVTADPEGHVIMVSADATGNTVVETNALGAKAFLSKPFTADKVVEALRKNAAFR